MEIALILVFLVMLTGLVTTLSLSGRGDQNYTASTKGNITRLTLIYVALAVVLIVGIVLYVML